MGKGPTKGCVLATIIAIKLCVYYVVLYETGKIFQTALIDNKVNDVDYVYYAVAFMAISGIGFVLDFMLLLSSFSNHFTFTKRVAIAGVWIQVLLFVPALIALIVFACCYKDVVPGWTHVFNGLPPRDKNYSALSSPEEVYSFYYKAAEATNFTQVTAQCCGYMNKEEWSALHWKYMNLTDKNESNESTTTSASTTTLDPFYVPEYPDSCCHNVNCVNGTVYDIGCYDRVTSFPFRYTLAIAIILLLFTLSTIPRNIWLYRYLEVNRRTERVKVCEKFIRDLQNQNEAANRQSEVKPLYRKDIEGLDSEKQNFLTSLDPQIVSTDKERMDKVKTAVASVDFSSVASSEQQQPPSSTATSQKQPSEGTSSAQR